MTVTLTCTGDQESPSFSLLDALQNSTHALMDAEGYTSNEPSNELGDTAFTSSIHGCLSEKFTVLEMVYIIADRREIIVRHRIRDYIDLQYEIASNHPKSKQMFICQFADGTQARSRSSLSPNCSLYIRDTSGRLEIPISTK